MKSAGGSGAFFCYAVALAECRKLLSLPVYPDKLRIDGRADSSDTNPDP
jgi:hypothetical protein